MIDGEGLRHSPEVNRPLLEASVETGQVSGEYYRKQAVCLSVEERAVVVMMMMMTMGYDRVVPHSSRHDDNDGEGEDNKQLKGGQ